MSMRSAAWLMLQARMIQGSGRTSRYFSDGRGRILSEEEKAAENIYIQKMEREKMEKARKKLEKEKAAAERENVDKKIEGEAHKG